jgi:hypothetical protein
MYETNFCFPGPFLKEWTVSVDTHLFCKEKKQWGYEITLRRSDSESSTSSKQNIAQVFHTRRTLRDFCLLELALLQEFSGSLLVPVLELYCVLPAGDIEEMSKPQNTDHSIPQSLQTLLNSPEALEPELLQWWLTDVIHGIRGDGEVLLNHATPQQVIFSDSMQIFFSQSRPGEVLYKNLSLQGGASTFASEFGKINSQTKINATSAPDALLRSMLSCFSVGVDSNANCNTNFGSTNTTTVTDFFPKCASRSIFSTNTHDNIPISTDDNFVGSSSVAWNEHVGLAHFSTRHGRENYSAPNNSDILDVYKVFFESFNSLIPHVQQKIDVLLELESTHGIAWKSFAESLSNLLSFEKVFLESKIGTLSSSENKNKLLPKPFKKNEIDDCIKLLGHHKEERGTLGLQALHIMIESFHTDTRSIPRSLNVYLLTHQKRVRAGVVQPSMKNTDFNHPSSSAVESAERVKQFVVQKIDLVKKQLNLGSETFASTTLNEFEEDTCVNSSLHESFTKHSPSCNKILADEAMLHSALGRLSQATPIRIARMSWKYFKAEAAQASLLSSAAADLKSKLAHSSIENQIHELKEMNDEKGLIDNDVEQKLVERILDLSASDSYLATHREIALEHHKEQVGRWDAQFTLTILAATGVADAQVRIEETTRELRFVRNIAIELRKCVDRYAESLETIKRATKGLGTEKANFSETPWPNYPHSQPSNLFEARSNFVTVISQMFSASLASKSARKTPSNVVFAYAGIDISDPSGWLSALHSNRKAPQAGRKGLCGKLAADYFIAKDRETSIFLAKVDQALHKYEERVERIESSVYMHCVGIQLEKHFSKVRADSLAEWEKKTDIIQAITIATRKRLPQLVNELERKLESFDSKVSHTYVKQAKERHLACKNIKAELQELADRRLDQAKESALEIIIGLIRLWAECKYKICCEFSLLPLRHCQHVSIYYLFICTFTFLDEETNAAIEVTILENAIQEIERCVRDQDVEADGVAKQLF